MNTERESEGGNGGLWKTRSNANRRKPMTDDRFFGTTTVILFFFGRGSGENCAQRNRNGSYIILYMWKKKNERRSQYRTKGTMDLPLSCSRSDWFSNKQTKKCIYHVYTIGQKPILPFFLCPPENFFKSIRSCARKIKWTASFCTSLGGIKIKEEVIQCYILTDHPHGLV